MEIVINWWFVGSVIGMLVCGNLRPGSTGFVGTASAIGGIFFGGAVVVQVIIYIVDYLVELPLTFTW